MRVVVRNAGNERIPNIAVTVQCPRSEGGQNGSFDRQIAGQAQADKNRPNFVVDTIPGSSRPASRQHLDPLERSSGVRQHVHARAARAEPHRHVRVEGDRGARRRLPGLLPRGRRTGRQGQGRARAGLAAADPGVEGQRRPTSRRRPAWPTTARSRRSRRRRSRPSSGAVRRAGSSRHPAGGTGIARVVRGSARARFSSARTSRSVDPRVLRIELLVPAGSRRGRRSSRVSARASPAALAVGQRAGDRIGDRGRALVDLDAVRVAEVVRSAARP